jgi:hypothetical protein
MEPEQFVEQQMEECRIKFEGGDFRQLIHAFRWCTMYSTPLPDWIADEALQALQFTLDNGGAAGRGKTGGHKAQIARDAVHRERHRVAAWQLDRRRIVGGNRADAFKRASEYLAGKFAQGGADAIEKSYNKIARQFASFKSD